MKKIVHYLGLDVHKETRRTLVEVKRKFFINESSCLERGSAATRTVVRSISRLLGVDELTHISRINRR
jgi:hypothetical protein